MLIYLLNLAVHLCIGKVYLLLLLNVEKMVGILPNSITFIRIVLDIQIYNVLKMILVHADFSISQIS